VDWVDVATVIQVAGQAGVPATSRGPIYDADAATQRALRSTALQRSAPLRATAAAFNWWGGPGVIWFAALLWLGARAARRRRWSEIGLRCAEGLALSSIVSTIVKVFVGRARPFVTPGEPWHWFFRDPGVCKWCLAPGGWADARHLSTPSGHTMAAFVFAAAVSVSAARWTPPLRTAVVLAAFASALLVAFARLYTNQHWLSDVIAGAVLGGTTSFAVARWHVRHPDTGFDRVMLGPSTPGNG
jgi:membrane-associated phospholipid phosphatase